MTKDNKIKISEEIKKEYVPIIDCFFKGIHEGIDAKSDEFINYYSNYMVQQRSNIISPWLDQEENRMLLDNITNCAIMMLSCVDNYLGKRNKKDEEFETIKKFEAEAKKSWKELKGKILEESKQIVEDKIK